MSTLVIRQGKTLREGWIWCDPLPDTNPPEPDESSPVVITGWDARLQLRRRVGDEDPLVSLTVGAGLTITGAAGRIDAVMAKAITADLTTSSGYWDLEVESPGGDVYEIDSGRFTLKREVTR